MPNLRIIELEVADEYVLGGGVPIGARGSHNDVVLRLTFNEMWDGLTKSVTFFDARSTSACIVYLTTDKIVDGNTRVYDVPIPSSAKAYAGEVEMSVRGVEVNGESIARATMSVKTCFEVLESVYDEAAEEAADVDATTAQQLQAQIDAVLDDIVSAVESAQAAAESEQNAFASAQSAMESKLAAKNSEDNAEIFKIAAENAKNAAETANNQIQNMSVSAIDNGNLPPTVTKQVIDGALSLVFGLKSGEKGETGERGLTGDTGNGIESITLIEGTHAAGTSDKYEILYTDGTRTHFYVYNGADGQGSGDMLKNVYDTQNKATDIYAYAEDKANSKIPKVTNATANNIATLTSDGGIADGGLALSVVNGILRVTY